MDLYILELNPRSSRTIPFISKVTGVPMIDVAIKVMNGTLLTDLGYDNYLIPNNISYTIIFIININIPNKFFIFIKIHIIIFLTIVNQTII